MLKKKDIIAATLLTLTLSILFGTAFVNARPTDPTEGDLSEVTSEGDWNWGISAGVHGYWVWFWMCRPPYIIFTEAGPFNASRWGGLGVWYTGNLNITYGYTGVPTNGTAYTTGGFISVDPYSGQDVSTHHIYCGATSGFANWIGQSWTRTVWAVIDM